MYIYGMILSMAYETWKIHGWDSMTGQLGEDGIQVFENEELIKILKSSAWILQDHIQLK